LATQVTALAAMPVLVAAAASCHPDRGRPMHPESPPGSWYVVERGETLEQIAARAGVPVEDLLEINGLTQAGDARAGRLIFVLAGARSGAGAGAESGARAVAAASSLPGPGPPDRTAPLPPLMSARVAGYPTASPAALRWPLDAVLVGSAFGTRDGRQHEGIDLPAPLGTPVYAAGPGQVIYAGDAIRGYGNLVVVQHDGDLLTVYAHNSALLVREGDRVSEGQRIALVGQTGRASGPHLHFEVRSGQIPQDPMSYLPRVPASPSPLPAAGGSP
jgi:murein DD-endopeptidase MepM/ murein hydrolase activator NlpD